MSKSGLEIARRWTKTYGESWVVGRELLDTEFRDFTTVQAIIRALTRAGVAFESRDLDGRSKEYRLAVPTA